MFLIGLYLEKAHLDIVCRNEYAEVTRSCKNKFNTHTCTFFSVRNNECPYTITCHSHLKLQKHNIEQ